MDHYIPVEQKRILVLKVINAPRIYHLCEKHNIKVRYERNLTHSRNALAVAWTPAIQEDVLEIIRELVTDPFTVAR